jgi:hypothetical protein
MMMMGRGNGRLSLISSSTGSRLDDGDAAGCGVASDSTSTSTRTGQKQKQMGLLDTAMEMDSCQPLQRTGFSYDWDWSLELRL